MNKIKGFTLLEVLIAITLTGLVMGSLFAMQSQNKQLTFRALAALERIAEQRESINLAWLGASDTNYQSISPQQKRFRPANAETLVLPELLKKEQTQVKHFDFKLQSIDIIDSSEDILFSTTRWVKNDKFAN